MNMENRQAYSHPLGLQNCSDIKVERSESHVENVPGCVNSRITTQYEEGTLDRMAKFF
jgi:hypothetical protein